MTGEPGRCVCGHQREEHLQDVLGAGCFNRYCACEQFRQRRSPMPTADAARRFLAGLPPRSS